ncbi:hypothetical protein ACHAQJ_010469 [Trichoderma viride]
MPSLNAGRAWLLIDETPPPYKIPSTTSPKYKPQFAEEQGESSVQGQHREQALQEARGSEEENPQQHSTIDYDNLEEQFASSEDDTHKPTDQQVNEEDGEEQAQTEDEEFYTDGSNTQQVDKDKGKQRAQTEDGEDNINVFLKPSSSDNRVTHHVYNELVKQYLREKDTWPQETLENFHKDIKAIDYSICVLTGKIASHAI